MSSPERGFNRRRFLRSGAPVALGVFGLAYGVTWLIQKGAIPQSGAIAAAPETATPTGTPAFLPPTEAPTPTVIDTGTPTPFFPTETTTVTATSTTTETPAATATRVATTTSIKAPPPAETATPAKTPEVPKNVPCLILEDKYCSKAEVIDWTNPKGQKSKMIGFHLQTGVPLLMPIDGQVAKGKLPGGVAVKGLTAQIFDPNNVGALTYIFTGDLKFDNMLSLNKKKGDTFGSTQNTGIENAGGYNVIFYILRGTGQETTDADDELKKMFPEAFAKPSTKAAATLGSGGGTVNITTFYDNPPK